jgi:hypothetical protein
MEKMNPIGLLKKIILKAKKEPLLYNKRGYNVESIHVD